MRENDINFQPDELGCELGEAFAASPRPAIFDRDGASFDPAEFAQPLHKSSGQLALRGRRSRAQESDGRQLPRLLRARRARPRDGRAAESQDELAAFHSITSSARRRKDSCIVRPIYIAAFSLVANPNIQAYLTGKLNFVGCSTGKSAGFVPCKILCTRTALRRNI